MRLTRKTEMRDRWQGKNLCINKMLSSNTTNIKTKTKQINCRANNSLKEKVKKKEEEKLSTLRYTGKVTVARLKCVLVD